MGGGQTGLLGVSRETGNHALKCPLFKKKTPAWKLGLRATGHPFIRLREPHGTPLRRGWRTLLSVGESTPHPKRPPESNRAGGGDHRQ